MRSVYPSGAAFATASAAMLPPAPGRFSTMTGCPSDFASGSASARATTSGWPPGAKGTTILTGRDGCQSAKAVIPANAGIQAHSRNKMLRMVWIPVFTGMTLVVQYRREPALDRREVHALAMRIVCDLVAL